MKVKITISSFEPLVLQVDEMPESVSQIEVTLPSLTVKLVGIDGVGDVVADGNIMSVNIIHDEAVAPSVAIGIVHMSTEHLKKMHSYAQRIFNETYLLEKK